MTPFTYHPSTVNPVTPPEGHVSYQLLLRVSRPLRIEVGALGRQDLAAGWYLYTGSARRNLAARIQRHLRRDKRKRWHIDYLLLSPGVEVVQVFTSAEEECRWNQAVRGEVAIPGFGASDCRQRCGAHLLRIAEDQAYRLLDH